MYDDLPNPTLEKPSRTQALSHVLPQSEPTPVCNNQVLNPRTSCTTSLLQSQNQRPSTPPLRAPSPGIPPTPKTPKSLKRLTDELSQLASNPSLSPSRIRIHQSKLTKLIHSAQFAHAKIHLTEEARLQQKSEDRKRKARDQPCARKKIPTHGQAFATAEDLRRWRRDIVSTEYKKLQQKRVVQLKRRENLLDQVAVLERKIAEKEQNPRSRVRQSLDVLHRKKEEVEVKTTPVSAKINLLDEKLAEFVREGLDTTDHSDLDESCERADDNSESDGSIGPDIGDDDMDLGRIGMLD
ncbi:hypothetical protein HOY82DRAFT_536467 [Tuber indicum]|nr:hypothetical protein HOY82DRAFT_536467 [Tuber indicum]